MQKIIFILFLNSYLLVFGMENGISLSEIEIFTTSILLTQVDQFLKGNPFNIDRTSYNQRFPVHQAVMDCDYSALKSLIQRKFPINSFDTAGYTPLHYAAFLCDIKSIDIFVKRGTRLKKSNSIEKELPFALAHKQLNNKDFIVSDNFNPKDAYTLLSEYHQAYLNKLKVLNKKKNVATQ